MLAGFFLLLRACSLGSTTDSDDRVGVAVGVELGVEAIDVFGVFDRERAQVAGLQQLPTTVVDETEQLETAGMTEVASILQGRVPDKLGHSVTSIPA